MLKKLKELSYVGLILLSTAIVLVDLYGRVLAGEKLSLTEAAKVIPQEALIAVYLSTDSSIWSQLQQAAPPTKRLIGQMARWQADLGILNGIDYQQDIQPWIGNAVLAILPADDSALEGQKDNFLLVAGIKNKFQAFSFARKLEHRRNQQIQLRSYRDIPIVEITEANNQTLILGVLNQQVLISFDQKTVEQAIDTLKGAPSLAHASNLASMEQSNQVVQAYIPNYTSVWEEVLILPEPIQKAILKPLTPLRSVALGVEREQSGLRLWAIAHLDLSSVPQQAAKSGTLAKSKSKAIASDHLTIQAKQILQQVFPTSELTRIIEPLLDLIEEIDVTVVNTPS